MKNYLSNRVVRIILLLDEFIQIVKKGGNQNSNLEKKRNWKLLIPIYVVWKSQNFTIKMNQKDNLLKLWK